MTAGRRRLVEDEFVGRFGVVGERSANLFEAVSRAFERPHCANADCCEVRCSDQRGLAIGEDSATVSPNLAPAAPPLAVSLATWP